jgi:hypothetical protein
MLALSQAHSLAALRAAAIAFGFWNGWISGNQVPCAFDIVPAHLRASTVGAFNFLGGLVAGLGPLSGGFARGSIGLDRLMIYTAALLAVSAVLPVMAQRRMARRL